MLIILYLTFIPYFKKYYYCKTIIFSQPSDLANLTFPFGSYISRTAKSGPEFHQNI